MGEFTLPGTPDLYLSDLGYAFLISHRVGGSLYAYYLYLILINKMSMYDDKKEEGDTPLPLLK